MSRLTKRISYWPLYQHALSLLSIVWISVKTLFAMAIFVTISLLTFYFFPNGGQLFYTIVVLTMTGFVTGLVVSISFILDRKWGGKVYEWLFESTDLSREETGTVVFHFLIYFSISGIVLSILTPVGEFVSGIMTNRMNSSQTLSNPEFAISVSVLKMTALFLPVWVTFISIGIKTHMSKESVKKVNGDNSIVPHQFTSIAVVGYFGILGVIMAAVWVLLPALPNLVAYSLLIMIFVLLMVGVGIYYVDKSLLENFVDEDPEEIRAKKNHYPRLKTGRK